MNEYCFEQERLANAVTLAVATTNIKKLIVFGRCKKREC
jgi:hypothetical protein